MENKITVSKEFVDIYKNFNVSSQVDEMKKLSQRELYLLLSFCLDMHDVDIATVKFNFQPFETEVMEIFDIQDDKETKNEILLQLISETNDKYIETSELVCQDGNKLPEPYTKEEVRDLKISIINS